MKTIFGKVGAEKTVTDQFNPKTTILLKIGEWWMLRSMTLTDVVSPRAEIEDHEGNVIKQENGKNLRVKLRNKINTKSIDRMT